LVYERERETDFRDAVVTPDRQFGLDARPADHRRGDAPISWRAA
jgi:hypothetical protein